MTIADQPSENNHVVCAFVFNVKGVISLTEFELNAPLFVGLI